jgi:hypothetical protein
LNLQQILRLNHENTKLLDGRKFCKKKRLFFFSIQQWLVLSFFAFFLNDALTQRGVKFLDSKLLEASLAV